MSEGHYFTPNPAMASSPATVELALADGVVSLAVDRGVFSSRRVDPGTLVLLREAPAPPPAGTLLDLGCGYGPIGVTLARRSPKASVWAVDVNVRAVALARANAVALGLANLTVEHPDSVPPGLRFDQVWSNPPIRVGKDALHALLETWLPRLAPDGAAWLVVHRHLGADSLAAWLEREGWSAKRHASKQGYRLLRIGRAA